MTSTVLTNMGPGLVRERFILTSKDCTAAALTQTINLKSLPKYSVVFGALVIPKVIVAGPATCTLKVGLAAGATDTIVDAVNLMAAVADTTLGTSGVNAAACPFMATKAADTLTATFTTTTDNVSTVTSGEVWIDVFYWLTEDLTATGYVGNQTTPGGGL